MSGSVFIAHRIGIPLFITGGIGGIHRDGHNSKPTMYWLIKN